MARRSLSRLVYLAGLTTVLCMSSGLTQPVFPLHAQTLGASYGTVGAMAAMGSVMHAGVSLYMGRLADRAGHDFMFFMSALTVTLAAAAYVISSSLGVIGVGKALDSLFIAAYWPALESASHAAGPAAGASMGVVYTAYPVATFAASLVAGWTAARWGYRASFAAAMCVGAVGMIWSARNARGNPRARTLRRLDPAGMATSGAGQAGGTASDASDPHRQGRLLEGRRAGFAAAMLSCFSYCLLVALAMTFVPLLAEYRGLSVEHVGVLVGMYWLGRAVSSFPAGVLSERLGRPAVILPALVIGALGAALAGTTAEFAPLAAAVAMTGVCSGAVAPVAMALGADCARPWAHGWALGLCETMCGVGFVAAGASGGLLATAGGPALPFKAASLALACCVLILTTLFRADGRHRHPGRSTDGGHRASAHGV
jgi:AAHS family 4-hydroxybenzoate transporter-like MFS transporter